MKDFKEEERFGWEKRGKGVNSYTFWATDEPSGIWTELPLVSSEHIVASRSLKLAFTGNLKQKITNTFPLFNGNEAHFLKCQIVRISFSTQIAPAGVFKTNDDDGKTTHIAY